MTTNDKPSPHLLELAKTISEAQNGFRSFFEAYNRNLQGISNFAAVINNSLTGIGKIAEQVSAFNKNISLILPDITKFTDFAESIRKYREIEKTVLIESGWFICPSLDPVPINWISKAVHNYRAGKRDSITNLMKGIYGDKDWAYLGEVIVKWKTHRFFNKQRAKIIDDALDAHKRGQYTLSIPALLPIIEGISGDFCVEQKIKVGKSKSKLKAQKMLSELGKKGDIYLSELVLEFIENQLYIETNQLRLRKNKKYLNRHGILHGAYSGYADCARSLRCFLLLDVLTLL